MGKADIRKLARRIARLDPYRIDGKLSPDEAAKWALFQYYRSQGSSHEAARRKAHVDQIVEILRTAETHTVPTEKEDV